MIGNTHSNSELILDDIIIACMNIIQNRKKETPEKDVLFSEIMLSLGRKGSTNIILNENTWYQEDRELTKYSLVIEAIKSRDIDTILKNIAEWMQDKYFYMLLGKHPLPGILNSYPPIINNEDQNKIFLESLTGTPKGNIKERISIMKESFSLHPDIYFKTIDHLSIILDFFEIAELREIFKHFSYSSIIHSIILHGSTHLYDIFEDKHGRHFITTDSSLELSVESNNTQMIEKVIDKIKFTITSSGTDSESVDRLLRLNKIGIANNAKLQDKPLFHGLSIDAKLLNNMEVIKTLVENYVLIVSDKTNRVNISCIYSPESIGDLKYLSKNEIKYEPDFTNFVPYSVPGEILEKTKITKIETIRTTDVFDFAYEHITDNKEEFLSVFMASVSDREMYEHVSHKYELNSFDNTLGNIRTTPMNKLNLPNNIRNGEKILLNLSNTGLYDRFSFLFNYLMTNERTTIANYCEKYALPATKGLMRKLLQEINSERISYSLFLLPAVSWGTLNLLINSNHFPSKVKVNNKVEKKKLEILDTQQRVEICLDSVYVEKGRYLELVDKSNMGNMFGRYSF